MDSVVKINNVTKTYNDAGFSRCVFQNLNLTIPVSHSLAVVGRSGTGKTTLLNLLSGIDLPDQGSIIVKGNNIVNFNETQRTFFRRQNIGFVFQAFNLITSLTVRENLLLPLQLSGMKHVNDMEELIRHYLSEVGLINRAQSFPEQLSGGEQQRIALVRAIIHQPELILADEPTGNLDNENSAIVLEMLFDLVRRIC